MKISILCSDPQHPINARLEAWKAGQCGDRVVELCRKSNELSGGDFLFLISCSELITKETRTRYKHSLVVHASDLPRGRGWSPYIWLVLAGESEIPVTLLEAADPVDSGRIWLQTTLKLEGHELLSEINEKLFDATCWLMDKALNDQLKIVPRAQSGEPTYFEKRNPNDSQLDPNLSIAAQFEKMRVADPVRYPSFFDHRGHRYRLTLTKVK